MRYQMRQKMLAFGDDFAVQDSQGNDRYYVDGKVLTFRDKADVKDMQGNQVAQIQRKMLALRPTYDIYRNGHRAARIKRSLLSLFRPSFDISTSNGSDLDVQGDFLQREYRFSRGGRPVAHVSKKFFSLTDTYGVDVAEGEDEVLVLSSAVVIDMLLHDD